MTLPTTTNTLIGHKLSIICIPTNRCCQFARINKTIDQLKTILFYSGFATLITHELDAILNHEWRVLLLNSWLPDDYGMLAFLFGHIPIFAVLMALIASKNDHIRFRTRIGISVFLVIHGLLHTTFRENTSYEFATATSHILIFGGSIFEMLHLLIEYLEMNKTST